jgi:hypothetical protein
MTAWRGLYTATTGELFGVADNSLYSIDENWDITRLGPVTPGRSNNVSMSDNGLTLIVVDGSENGFTYDLTERQYGLISDPAFYGADKVDCVDTFFLFNRPGTNQFYLSPSEWVQGLQFDALDIAAKTGRADLISSLIVMHREVWLLGTQTSEIWYDVGASDFAFQPIPGAFIEHGCAASQSVSKYDNAIYFLSRDQQGNAMILEGAGYKVTRVSTNAIESELLTYRRLDDAIGFCYQQEGHAFYQLSFPTADKTWVYDIATQVWHERAWSDPNGKLHRHRANCHAFAYGKNVVGDHSNGKLYYYDLNTYTDDSDPITHIRSFPHMVDDGKRVFYRQFIADMEVGSTTLDNDPTLSLRWSDTRGASWGNPITQSLGKTGKYLTSVQFQRLGMARDRVFELSWSGDFRTALNGAFVEANKSRT